MELGDADALEAATQVLHIHYLKEHVLLGMKPPAAEDVGGKAVVIRPRPKVGQPRRVVPEPVAAAAFTPAAVDVSAIAAGESVTLYAAPED